MPRSPFTAFLPALLSAVLLAGCAAAPAEPLPRPAGSGTVIVMVRDLPNDDGQLLVNLFLDHEGFPNDPEAAFAAITDEIRDGRATVRIDDVPAGPFAVSVFHDEDLDRELDTNLIGIPSEMWGVSRDAGGFMGPPSYDDAKLELRDADVLEVEIEMG